MSEPVETSVEAPLYNELVLNNNKSTSSQPQMMESDENMIFGENSRDIFIQKLQREMKKRNPDRPELVSNDDQDDVNKFNRNLEKFLKKRRDQYERYANDMTDEQLVQALPTMLEKYLLIIGGLWREQKYVGILDICFENRNHLKEMWVLCQCTYNTYGVHDYNMGKIKDVLPPVRLLKVDDETNRELFGEAFSKVVIDEDFCQSKIPVHVRVLSNEEETGKLPMQINWIYKMFNRPTAYEATESIVPDFLLKKLQLEGGSKAVRSHIAETCLFEASVKFEYDLFQNEQVQIEMQNYIDNNAFGELVLRANIPVPADNPSETKYIETERITICFPDYP